VTTTTKVGDHYLEFYKDSALSESVLTKLREFAKALPVQGEAMEPEGPEDTEAGRKARWRNMWREPNQTAGFIRKASGDEWIWKFYSLGVTYYPRYGPVKAGGRVDKDMQMICSLSYERTAGRLTAREAALGAYLVWLRMSRYRPWLLDRNPSWQPAERLESLLKG
jgi:hypothetical protein